MDTRPIGVFDSGLGGLTAVRELRRSLPGEDIVYFGDTGRVPYGTRGQDTILQYARQDIRFLISKNVKCILAACGTVSSVFPAQEAQRLPVPYAGVVETAARCAARATKNGKIGVIGTAATVRSGSYERALRAFLPEVHITAKACPLFVPLVENGFIAKGDPVTALAVERYLREVRDAGVDTLILGCTHYPLLRPAIHAFMGDGVTLIDVGQSTALSAAEMLNRLGLLQDGTHKGSVHYYVSDTPDDFAALATIFLGPYAGGEVERVAIEDF